MSEPYLAMHVCGGLPVYDIVYEDEDGQWSTINGWPVYPYRVVRFIQSIDPIPQGWMEHLEALAMKMHRPERRKPLSELIPKALEAPIRRRV